MRDKGTQQKSHSGASRNAKRNRRNQDAALTGVIGTLRCDDAANVSLTEGFSRSLLGPRCMAIRDPINNRRTYAGNGAEPGPDPTATKDEPPVPEHVFGAQPHAREGVDLHFLGNRGAPDREIRQFGQGEYPQDDRQEGQAVVEVDEVHRPTKRTGLRIGTYHRKHDAE